MPLEFLWQINNSLDCTMMNPPLESLMPAFKQFQLVSAAIRVGVVTALAGGPRSLESLATEL